MYVMRTAAPGAVSEELANKLLAQLRAQREEELQEFWVHEKILVPTGIDESPYSVDMEVLKCFWGKHCVQVVRIAPHNDVLCSCAFFCSRGHCCHQYAIEQLDKGINWVGQERPPVAEARAADFPLEDEFQRGPSAEP